MHPRDLRSARARELPGPRVSADALTLSVVIPALDEAENLDALLSDLHQQDVPLNIVVADGGSSDGTRDIARNGGATVVRSATGRARQMNAARQAVNTTHIVFLHADSRLQHPGQLRAALRALSDDSACGHFQLSFGQPGFRYAFLEAKSALTRQNTINGDQGFLVSTALFDAVGGFDESLPFLEDQRFVRDSLDAGARWVTLPGVVTTSARRFQTEGFGNRYFAMALIMAAWAADANEFFEEADQIYVANPEEKLKIAEVLQALRAATRRMGVQRATKTWLKAARFARQNAWQLAFVLDVALDEELEGETPFLDLYEARVSEHVDHWVLDGLIAAAAAGLLLGIFPAVFNEA